jgi:tRNA pseudouridine55 synthase
VKYKGSPLYQYARSFPHKIQSIDWEHVQRNIYIYSLDLISFEHGRLSFRVQCSKGTYVRVLAQDICVQLDTLGVVSKLRRTRASGFDLSAAMNFEEFKLLSLEGIQNKIQPMEKLELEIKSFVVSHEDVLRRLMLGQKIKLLDFDFSKEFIQTLSSENNEFILKNSEGKFLAICEFRKDTQLVKVKRSLR